MANNGMDQHHWLVDQNESGSRLDRALLRRFKHAGKGLVMRLIRKGNVRIDGRRVKPSTRLAAGERIFIPASLQQVATPERGVQRARSDTLLSIPTLYQDEDLLVVDKPAGAVVHGGSGYSFGLVEQLKSVYELPDLRLAHRLDRDTSGCLLLVKSLPALRQVAATFRDHEAHKTYLAWVVGRMADGSGRMVSHLAKGVVRGGERMVTCRDDGREAVTDFQVIMYSQVAGCTLSLLALQPHHGRTHQLRVQLQEEGYPIAGDGKYGSARQLKMFRA
ncbi:MAG: RluA family pseudouridine synthase, partial [Mariprofundales bacterium]|nr:RluA family pseudouridine synthase [Mariprofundales bacterium]